MFFSTAFIGPGANEARAMLTNVGHGWDGEGSVAEEALQVVDQAITEGRLFAKR
jgi:hypothetical protein